jgi:squalene-hopene/tetraprenyl-beta-curcumene cyclase
MHYLMKCQSLHGSWLPLWFGNQWTTEQSNPVYGTACVIRDVAGLVESPMLERGVKWLLQQQNKAGGWGGNGTTPDSIEETAVTLTALHRYQEAQPRESTMISAAITNGTARLLDLTADGTQFTPTPIGLYFAQLWYSEALYPVIWTASALRSVGRF